MTDRSIAAYEAGATTPTADTVAQLAQTLSFPIEFFEGAPIGELPATRASFRALSTLTAGQRDAALAAGRLAFDFADWLAKNFNLPIPDLPDFRHDSPESAADALRAHWQRGERPIRNMVHLLESKGIRVFSLPEESRDIDAFSLWHEGVPYVFLNTMKSGERGRFDAAHELGHLVLHRHAAPQGRKAEHQADQFASAFLMPRGAVVASTPTYVDVDRLIRLKANWNVSVAALAHRLHDLGILSEWIYRNMCIEISQRGFRTAEPNGIERETSQLLDKVFRVLRAEGVTRAALARTLHLPQGELESLVFGLVISGIEGGRATDAPNTHARPRGHLKLV